jgi:hypothetical protein
MAMIRAGHGMVGPLARTPEELEAMLEDAFIVKDAAAAAELFEETALLVDRCASSEARGRPAIARAIASVWDEWAYVADSRRVFQGGDLAFCFGPSLNVLPRRPDGAWRLVIAMFRNEKEETHA